MGIGPSIIICDGVDKTVEKDSTIRIAIFAVVQLCVSIDG